MLILSKQGFTRRVRRFGMRGHVGSSRLLNGRATRNVSGFPNSVDSNCATKNHPARLGSRNPSFRSKPVSSTLLPISGRRPRETDGRARNWLADRFRLNPLASRPQIEIARSRLRRAYGGLRPKIKSTGVNSASIRSKRPTRSEPSRGLLRSPRRHDSSQALDSRRPSRRAASLGRRRR